MKHWCQIEKLIIIRSIVIKTFLTRQGHTEKRIVAAVSHSSGEELLGRAYPILYRKYDYDSDNDDNDYDDDVDDD